MQILNCESSGKQEQDYDYNMNKKRSLCDLAGLLALTMVQRVIKILIAAKIFELEPFGFHQRVEETLLYLGV